MHFKNSLIKTKILKTCIKNSRKLKNLNKMTMLIRFQLISYAQIYWSTTKNWYEIQRMLSNFYILNEIISVIKIPIKILGFL